MTATTVALDLARLLDRLGGGSFRATIDGTLAVELNADGRNLTVDLDPIVGKGGRIPTALHLGHLSLWKARGVPSALARAGWQVRLRDGSRELVRLGRDVSPITGHVHVSPAALAELGRFL
ncbi:MAG: hypothetical protein ACRECT_03800 [Thermoplasmata archaeon]